MTLSFARYFTVLSLALLSLSTHAQVMELKGNDDLEIFEIQMSGNRQLLLGSGLNGSLTTTGHIMLLDSNLQSIFSSEIQFLTPGTTVKVNSVAISDSLSKVVVAGSIGQPSSRREAFVLCLNMSGGLEWALRSVVGVEQIIEKVRVDSKGNLFVCGMTDKSNNLRKGYLTKLDWSGNELWSKTYSRSNTLDFMNLNFLDSGEMQLLGFGAISPYPVLVIKVDSAGNLLKQKAYQISGGHSNVFAAHNYANHTILVGASWGGPSANYSPVLISIDTAGSVLNSRALTSTLGNLRPKRSVMRNDGSILMSANNLNGSSRACIIEIDSALNTSKAFSIKNSMSNSDYHSVVLNDSHYYAAGRFIGTRSSALLLKGESLSSADICIESVPMNNLALSVSELSVTLTQASDQLFTIRNDHTVSSYSVNLDTLCSNPGLNTTLLAAPKCASSVFPNPSNGELNINLSQHQKAEIKIVNQLGQTVLQKNLSARYNRLDISALNNGIYTVSVSSETPTRCSEIKKVLVIR